MGKRDEREVEVKTLKTVVVPVRSGKAGAKSIRFDDLAKGIEMAKADGGNIMFDVPGENSPVDLGIKIEGAITGRIQVGSENAGLPETE